MTMMPPEKEAVDSVAQGSDRMNCFACEKNCVMHTEKYMDKTPCEACALGAKPIGKKCIECMKYEKICNFEEGSEDGRTE